MFYTAYTLLIVGLASQTLAEPVREPKLARMSTREIFGLHRRVIEGYAPSEQLCGDGDTCAEACGRGFRRCASDDGLTHCYNRSKKQTCCPGGSGDSCDNGYFCTADDDGQTWCCPEGLSLKECARKYDIPGPLTSQEVSTSTMSTSTSTSESVSASTSTLTTTKETKTTTTKASSTETSADASTTESSVTSTTEPTATRTKTGRPESTTTTKTVHHTSTSKSKPETSTTSALMSSTTLLIDVSSVLGPTGVVNAQTTALESTFSSVPSTTDMPSTTSIVGTNGSNRRAFTNTLMLFIPGAMIALARWNGL